MVVAIGHELPNDPPLSVSGNLYETRSENWSRGAVTLDFIRNNFYRVKGCYKRIISTARTKFFEQMNFKKEEEKKKTFIYHPQIPHHAP